MKKIIAVLFTLVVSFSVYAKGFDQKMFTPTFGFAGGYNIHESVKKGTFYTNEAGIGPTIGLDTSYAIKSNGFTMMANGMVLFIFMTEQGSDPYDSPSGYNMGFGIIPNFELLFGYTYGLGKNFELTAAIGPGFFMLSPALNIKLNASYFFSKKYGINFALGNSFSVSNMAMYGRGNSWIIQNTTSFTIGPVFRIE